ncbi:peptidase S41 [Algimonas arctica]|uniref:Peptidase S41 n=1 Tax=Algimonas arctica TaxID=1479486 RepID=A0A8J3CTU0_9PROT|nr:S41 family peptidase [Algimonas arctica]GHA98661.1 peptidase S41 [Algimonas arctica]
MAKTWILRAGTCLTTAAFLAACGGSGSSSTSPISQQPTPQPSGNTWTQGQFSPASQFKNECAAPRSGSDANGNAFSDVAGTLSDELFWLRSWSNETYLWYNEITDRNPNGFSNKLNYFDELKTTATTASGNARDRFHFTYDSAEWLDITTSGSSSGYGAQFALVTSSPPRDIRVAYIEPNSPASQAGLTRGVKILSVDGVDAINGSDTDTLNAGLFPTTASETHSFGIERLDGSHATISLTSATVTQAPVNAVSTFDQNGRTYGYVHFTTFSPRTAELALFEAFEQLQTANIDDLVLDLRYNGGGLLAIASQLSYMVAGPSRTSGLNFETLQFNDKSGGTNPVTGQQISPTPFYNTGVGFTVPSSRQAPTVSKPRVFVLTTSRSCSASEAVINGLRGIDVEVIQIGGQTCGKPYGFYATDNCGTTYFTIQFRGVNNKNFGDYADGFAPAQPVGTLGDVMPGCPVSDDFTKLLGDPTETMLSTAIAYASNGVCPTPTSVSTKTAQDLAAQINADPALDLRNDPRIRALEIAATLGETAEDNQP